MGDSGLSKLAGFCPALALWEIIEMGDSAEQSAQARTWPFDAALLFVDISGFTNLSTKLTVDCLQGHISGYFSALIEVIERNNGDVLRFAGDAVLCAWCVSSGASQETLTLCTRAACACALELIEKCGTYPIPELEDTSLSIQMGIGVSSMHAYRVGVPERWELLVYGEALLQVSLAESYAGKREAICSREAWAYVASSFKGESRGEAGCVLLLAPPEDQALPVEKDALEDELFAREVR